MVGAMGRMGRKCGKWVAGTLFEYETPQNVRVRNKRVGVLHRILQLCIVAYYIGYVMIYERGFEERCDVESTVTTKMKGGVYVSVEHLDTAVPGAICDVDVNGTCHAGETLPLGNGVTTGRCVPSDRSGGNHTCEIHAWCPVENDDAGAQVLREDVQDYTVLLKNFISFPKFGHKYRRCEATRLRSRAES
ncbi:unnamed protein product [Darwinula stevensoni]|uniref:Uncharacterized protein n=1 Tax=Darwinula stevensoni TaxID=69355 RepID=A0A7R9ABB1_9CRUS|nr:unnamed protein product [Darwinula stevensoni]CAG0899266.1 unnamed protein product [Darwinula stevensoni]